MKERIAQRMVCIAAFLIAGPASSAVLEHALVPNTTGGVFISCQNSTPVIAITRTANSTVVAQAGPSGVLWQHRLPQMNAEYDQYYVAPDGSAAVVALSQLVGNVYLVSGRRSPTILYGAVAAVDFQNNLVMIAHSDRERGPLIVSVYQVDTGDLVGTTRFMPPRWDDFQQFSVRLSGDGSFYYYLDETQNLRAHNVLTGKPITLDVRMPNGIQDVLLRSRDHGYVIASGKIYAVLGGELRQIETPIVNKGSPAKPAQPLHLVESTDRSIQPVVFHFGWGISDVASGQWLAQSNEGELLSASNGTAIVVHRHKGRVEVFGLTDSEPKSLRSAVIGSRSNALVCANAYGGMTFEKGQFIWHRAK